MSPCSLLEANPFMALVNAATSEFIKQSNSDEMDTTTGPIVTTVTPSFTSGTPPLSLEAFSLSTIVAPVDSKKPKESFAETLMNMLHDEEYSRIVTFLPDGQSFGIINAKVFSDEVMPKVLGIRTFSSFVRKLNRWGFERIMEKKTHDVDVFRHNLFHKGDWKLCRKIKCVGRLAKQQEQQQQAAPVIRPNPLTAMQQTTQVSALFSKVSALPTPPRVFQTQALQDVTSQVVQAALDALRRDENVATPNQANLQQLLQRQHMQARMMALQARQILRLSSSPRSSMALL
jgi:hypothetical protein